MSIPCDPAGLDHRRTSSLTRSPQLIHATTQDCSTTRPKQTSIIASSFLLSHAAQQRPKLSSQRPKTTGSLPSTAELAQTRCQSDSFVHFEEQASTPSVAQFSDPVTLPCVTTSLSQSRFLARRPSDLLPIQESPSPTSPAASIQFESSVSVSASHRIFISRFQGTKKARMNHHTNRLQHMQPHDLHSLAQEELLVENLDKYDQERPLDTLKRHSRVLAPISIDTRRQSRLPVDVVDPFGFDAAAETSPYDTARQYSQNERVRASFLGPQSPSSPGQQPPSSSSASSSQYTGANTATTPSTGTSSPISWKGPEPAWQKQRSASFGENQSQRAHVRASFMTGVTPMGSNGRPTMLSVATGSGSHQGRSKLSDEIYADTPTSTESAPSPKSSILPPIDYTRSKLYQRTLKAQKALEKDRAKAAAKGKISKADLEVQAQQTSRSEKRRSNAGSFVSDIGGFRSRSSLGWFRSSSEAALPLVSPAPSPTPPLPTSRSLGQLSAPGQYPSSLPPSPGIDPKYLSQQPQVPLPTPPSAAQGSRSASRSSKRGPDATGSRGPSPAPAVNERRSREPSTNSVHSKKAAGASNPEPAPTLPIPKPPTSREASSSSAAGSMRENRLREPSRESLGRRAKSTSPVPPEVEFPLPSPRLVSPTTAVAEDEATEALEDNSSPTAPTDSAKTSAGDELKQLPPRVSSIYATQGNEPVFDVPRRASDPDSSIPSTPASSESSAMRPVTPPSESPAQMYAFQQRTGLLEKPLPPPALAAVQAHSNGLLAPEGANRPRKSSFRILGAFGGGSMRGKKDENTPSSLNNSTASTQSAPVATSRNTTALSKTPSKSVKQSLFGRWDRSSSNRDGGVPDLVPSTRQLPPPTRQLPPTPGSRSLPASPVKSGTRRPREPMPPIAQPSFTSKTSARPSTPGSTTPSNRLSKKDQTNGAAPTRASSGFFGSFSRGRSKSAAAVTKNAWEGNRKQVPPPVPKMTVRT